MGTSFKLRLNKICELPLSLLIAIVVLSGSCATAWSITSSQVYDNESAIRTLEHKHDISNERWIRVDENMKLILERTQR